MIGVAVLFCTVHCADGELRVTDLDSFTEVNFAAACAKRASDAARRRETFLAVSRAHGHLIETNRLLASSVKTTFRKVSDRKEVIHEVAREDRRNGSRGQRRPSCRKLTLPDGALLLPRRGGRR